MRKQTSKPARSIQATICCTVKIAKFEGSISVKINTSWVADCATFLITLLNRYGLLRLVKTNTSPINTRPWQSYVPEPFWGVISMDSAAAKVAEGGCTKRGTFMVEEAALGCWRSPGGWKPRRGFVIWSLRNIINISILKSRIFDVLLLPFPQIHRHHQLKSKPFSTSRETRLRHLPITAFLSSKLNPSFGAKGILEEVLASFSCFSSLSTSSQGTIVTRLGGGGTFGLPLGP